MRKAINGKTYDTETAKSLGVVGHTEYKVLYKTKEGDYFYYIRDDEQEHIEPCLDDDGWITEILSSNEEYQMTFEEWKIQKRALGVVKEYVKNNMDNPFAGDFNVFERDNELVFSDGSGKYLSISLDSSRFSLNLDDEQYLHSYDIFKNRDNIISLYDKELGYKLGEEQYEM